MVIPIGKVVKTIGLKGEIKIYPYTQNSTQRFAVGQTISINGIHYTVASMRFQGICPIIKLSDLTTIEMVEPLINMEITIDSSQLPPINGHYGYQLKGYRVVYNGSTIGTLIDFEQYGPQLNARIQQGDHAFLVPLNAPFIQTIDDDGSTLIMKGLDGLL